MGVWTPEGVYEALSRLLSIYEDQNRSRHAELTGNMKELTVKVDVLSHKVESTSGGFKATWLGFVIITTVIGLIAAFVR